MARRRPLRPIEDRVDQWARSMIDGTLSGTVKIAKPAPSPNRPPVGGSGGGTIPYRGGGGSGSGETVTLTGTDRDAGGALVWSALVPGKLSTGFRTLELPTTDLPTGFVGYYDVRDLALTLASAGAATITVLAVDAEGETREVGSYTGPTPWRILDPHDFALDVLEREKIRIVVDAPVSGTFTANVRLVEHTATGIVDPTWIQVSAADVFDLHGVGDDFWTTSGEGLTIVRYSAGWQPLQTFEAPQGDASNARNRGITHDGTALWYVGSGGTVYRLSTVDGSILDSFALGTAENTGMSGIEWTGTDLWIRDASGTGTIPLLGRYSTTGTLSTSYSLPKLNTAGMALYGGNLWLPNRDDGTLWIIDPATGAVVETVNVSAATSSPTGCWVAADGTLYVSQDGAGVWERIEKVA